MLFIDGEVLRKKLWRREKEDKETEPIKALVSAETGPGLTYWGQELWCWSALEHNPHCRRAPRGQKAAFFTPLSVSHCLGWLRVGGRLGLFSQGRSLLLAEGNSLERWTIMSPQLTILKAARCREPVKGSKVFMVWGATICITFHSAFIQCFGDKNQGL